MSRPVLSIFYEIYDLVKRTFIHFRRQKISSAFIIVLALIFVAVLFTFLSFVQTISPFVYPLF